MLDAGRSLLWSEMRRFREPLLPAFVDAALAARFERTCSELRSISTAEVRYETISKTGKLAKTESSSTAISYDHLLSQKRTLLDTYEELIGLIREKPGFEGSLHNAPFERLKEAANEGPVIIVNCSEYGSHVIIVFASKCPSVIELDDDFRQMALHTFELYSDARHNTRSDVFGARLLAVTQQLWTLVVSRVVKELEEVGVPKRSRIWWCPTTFLTVLPFHAAGYGRLSLIDKYISSYTPTLAALIDARQLSSIAAVTSPGPKILVVAQTNSDLKAAGPELDVMRNLGPFVDHLDGQDATRASVLSSMSSHDWIHFICHGTVAASPFDSSLHLYDGDTLSLNDIIKARLPDAKFAFLAACHTAEQDSSGLMDEVLHLSGAMQFSGFRSVVGTMWAMVDDDGPYVAKKFYDDILRGNGDAGVRHTGAAPALWKATRAMRKEGFPIDRWVNFVHIGA